jgi:D-tagatose-1,6-bisphosphate aldolase subunit GatZ/KbaZ
MFQNLRAENKGICSICSANEYVLKAAFKKAIKDNSLLLIESTSNQVDQFGGYTGMKPVDFVAYVRSLAESVDFSTNRLILGGDHLGPNTWQKEPAEIAMEKASGLIHHYVKAGYTKIHLDTSMRCK